MTFPHERGNEASLSYWIDTTGPTSFPPLGEDAQADVVIVGAGIVGITAAYLLAKEGKSVIVLDRERVAMSETGHTTAHLQVVLDTRLADLVPRFGLEDAKRAWDSQLEAVRFIESTSLDHRIDCELSRLDAYLYSPLESDRAMLKEERRLARKIGYACEWADASKIPFPAKHALSFPEQGKFHVRKYLLGLLEQARKLGAKFHEGTEVTEVEGGPSVKVTTRDGYTVKARWFLSASNTPFVGAPTIDMKLMPYRTYVIGALVPKNVFEDKLYWDTLDPYHYVRVEPKLDHDLVILGGEDHRVGAVEDTNQAWGNLWRHLREATPQFTPAYQWSGEIIETLDDFPYIGRIPGRGENELMVTGDSGTGMTNGTLGAIMMAERMLGRGTPWDEMYDAQRLHADGHALAEWAKRNLRDVGTLAKRTLQRSDISDVAELAYGEGAILKHGLKPVAVSRLDDGRMCAVSGICSHAGCTVKWNSGETSWDCPCHGSRFSPTGEVLHGPAKEPLAAVDLDDILGDRKERSHAQQP